jgi:unsaturated rhamnogalacturonyl hydrolase
MMARMLARASVAISIVASLLAPTGCASARAPKSKSEPPDQFLAPLSDAIQGRALVNAMTRVAEWQLANPSSHKPYEWHVAPFWSGLARFAPVTASPDRYFNAIRKNGEANDWKPGPRPLHADDNAITQSYFLLYERTHDRRMIEPALGRFDAMVPLPFSEALDFSNEKTSREWVWCDALFMTPPALALASRAIGEHKYIDLMNRLWWKTTDYLYDKDEHLYYRDSRFFDQRSPSGRKIFWSRGNGWVFAGLALVLEYLPPDDPARPRLEALFKEMAPAVLRAQGPDGYWPSSLLDPAQVPGPETSGTGFFTFGFAWGINHGLLDRGTYEPPAQKGWSALVRAVHPDGKLGYVQQVGASPEPTSAETTEIYGIGALLHAGTELHRMVSGR